MKFANLGADFKLVACLGLLAAIASLAVGIVAAGQAAIEGELERTLAASAADARSVEDLYDRFEDIARLRSRLAVDGDPQTRTKTIEAIDADARGASVLFDAAIRSAPGLVASIDRARQSFVRLKSFGRRRRGEIAGR